MENKEMLKMMEIMGAIEAIEAMSDMKSMDEMDKTEAVDELEELDEKAIASLKDSLGETVTELFGIGHILFALIRIKGSRVVTGTFLNLLAERLELTSGLLRICAEEVCPES